MAIYLGKKEIGIVSEPTIKQQNISYYKTMDSQYTQLEGGDLPTDEEYEAAEERLQVLYAKIMGGEYKWLEYGLKN